jgi:hypothetical protein
MLLRTDAGGRTSPVDVSQHYNASRPSMEFDQHPGISSSKSHPESELPYLADSSSASGHGSASSSDAATAYTSDTIVSPIDNSRSSSSYAHTLSLPAGPSGSRSNAIASRTEASMTQYAASSASSDVTGTLTNILSHDTFGNEKGGGQDISGGKVGAGMGAAFQILNRHDGDEEPPPPAYSV